MSDSDNTTPSAQFPHSALQCLVAVGAHHGISTSVERLLHEFSLPSVEPELDQVARMARHLGLKAKVSRLDWRGLAGLTGVFPILVRLTNGNSVVVAGIKHHPEKPEVAVFDPLTNQPGIFLVARDQFLTLWQGEVLFLKRGYALTDPDQPFGLAWFFPELLRQGAAFRDIAVAAIFLMLLALTTPLFVQLVIDKVLVHQSISTLTVLTVGIFMALIFEAIFQFLRQYLLLATTNKIDIRLATRTFSHLLSLPIDYFEATTAGVTVRHMQQVEKIRQFLTGRLFTTLLDATALLVFLPIMYFYSPKLTLVTLGFAGLIAAVIVSLLGPFRRRLRALYDAEAQRQAMLVETIQGVRTVKSAALEPMKRREWDHKAAQAVLMQFSVGKISLSANTVVQLLEKLMTVAIIAVGAGDVFAHALTVGGLIAFQMLSGRVSHPLVQIVTLIQEYQETALSINMLAIVMNHPPERSPTKSGLSPVLKGRIQFDKVSFRYHGTTAPVLDRLSFNIPAGGVLGVVGKSGCGKTTLTRLVQGLYPIQEGVVRIDGYDIREIDLPYLRRNIGVVLQDNFLFRGSVRDNIAMTKPDASLEEIAYAARLAGATDFIEKMPQGYDTLLEENAANLSGGQKQRLAIARALLPQPPILILDEATSALDPESEYVVMTNLAHIAAGRTVIMVSHRLSTLVPCHAIAMMDSGRIIAFGNHQELLNRSPDYRHLWERQNQNR